MQTLTRIGPLPLSIRVAAGLELFRPGNCLMTAIGVVAGAVVAVGLEAARFPITLSLGAIAGFTFAAGGNSLNDYVDRLIDRKAHPTRPIPSGRLSAHAALQIQSVLFGVATVSALAIAWVFGNPFALLLVVPALGLMVAYELHLKARGFLGNVAISLLTGAPFVMGGISVDRVTSSVLILSLLAVLTNLGREIVKDIEDLAADAGSRHTLPMRIGPARARLAAQAAILSGVVLSPLPWIVGASGIAYLPTVAVADAFLVAAALVAKHPSRSSRLAKLGMMAGLVAFVAGRLSL